MLLAAYESVRPLKPYERQDLVYRLSYPEKLWKIVNFYYNSGKAWIPGKGLVAGLATEGTRTMTFTGTYLAMFAERGRGYFKELNVKVSDADKEDDR